MQLDCKKQAYQLTRGNATSHKLLVPPIPRTAGRSQQRHNPSSFFGMRVRVESQHHNNFCFNCKGSEKGKRGRESGTLSLKMCPVYPACCSLSPILQSHFHHLCAPLAFFFGGVLFHTCFFSFQWLIQGYIAVCLPLKPAI